MSARAAPLNAGIGWRQPHERALLGTPARPGFIEVHSENYFHAGGAALALLEQARADFDVSLHGVGLSLGSVIGVDDWHLERLAALARRIEPRWVSDHACFARVSADAVGRAAAFAGDAIHAADLLPLAFSDEALAVMVANVQRVQERLRRPLLVENLSACIQPPGSTLTETAFLAALCQRSGCRLLLDVNNLYVNARNAQLRGECADPLAQALEQIADLPVGLVGEIHLAGHCEVEDEGVRMAIDDHGSRVIEPVWALYRAAIARFGAVPTLIEWDTDLPAFDVLMDEAREADRQAGEVLRMREWSDARTGPNAMSGARLAGQAA